MDLEEDDAEEDEDQVVPMPGAPCNMMYLPIMLDPDEEFEKVDGNSETRKAIIEEIAREQIRRPEYNLRRRDSGVYNRDDLDYFHPQ